MFKVHFIPEIEGAKFSIKDHVQITLKSKILNHSLGFST